MRLFVGVTLEDAAVAAALEAADGLRRRLGGALRARWVSAANMHLTVRFIGNVEEARAPAVLDALRPDFPLSPFDVRFDGCGLFPPSGAPRVIWIGVGAGLATLRLMHEACNRRLLPLGFEPERRPFSPHLTLARIVDAPRTSRHAVRRAIEALEPRPIRSVVDSATVFLSRPSSRGASYEPLLTIRCAG